MLLLLLGLQARLVCLHVFDVLDLLEFLVEFRQFARPSQLHRRLQTIYCPEHCYDGQDSCQEDLVGFPLDCRIFLHYLLESSGRVYLAVGGEFMHLREGSFAQADPSLPTLEFSLVFYVGRWMQFPLCLKGRRSNLFPSHVPRNVCLIFLLENNLPLTVDYLQITQGTNLTSLYKDSDTIFFYTNYDLGVHQRHKFLQNGQSSFKQIGSLLLSGLRLINSAETDRKDKAVHGIIGILRKALSLTTFGKQARVMRSSIGPVHQTTSIINLLRLGFVLTWIVFNVVGRKHTSDVCIELVIGSLFYVPIFVFPGPRVGNY